MRSSKSFDLTGQTFSRLTVVEYSHKNKYGHIIWKCLCVCGSFSLVATYSLRGNKIKSCGCLRFENIKLGAKKNVTHGDTVKGKSTVEYTAWVAIKARCYNKKNKHYGYYGGRGITLFDGWKNSFPDFLKHVGRRPSPDHSLDRHPDRNGNYEPGNVRWATKKEQANNKSNNRIIEANGITKNITEWAEFYGMARHTLHSKLNRGHSFESIVKSHISKNHSHSKTSI